MKFFLYLFLFSTLLAEAQEKRGDIRIMFYNVENLFDIENDSSVNDDEFTPDGSKKWNTYRYNMKLKNLFKVISKIGEWSPPDIIALCEVENRSVLNDLVFKTPLYKYNYEIVHFDSPDSRGIDVACLYNGDKISVTDAVAIPIKNPENPGYRTRDVLYVSMTTDKNDSIHLFVNHWPSRRGGESVSSKYRMLASNTLRHFIDSVFVDRSPNIIILGDFNDDPIDKSIVSLVDSTKNVSLKNLTNCSGVNCGTIKYDGAWNKFDQILISESLIGKSNNGLYSGQYRIGGFEFLMEDDASSNGERPFPTYRGPGYLGGFSDHLPVYVDLYSEKP